MSLRAFHVLFISASVVLAVCLGAWCLPAHPAWAATAFVAGFALVTYETWFLRKTRRLS
jgi:hypothetical protein